MKQRIQLAPAARRPYAPGELSQVYEKSDPKTRAAIDDEVGRLFTAKTGITRKLEPSSPADKLYVRQWLLIRDAVIALRRFRELSTGGQRLNLQASAEKSLAHAQSLPAFKPRSLAEVIEEEAPPEELPPKVSMKIVQGAHLAVEVIHMSEIFLDVWPHLIVHGLEAVAPWAMVIGGPLAIVANMMEIAEAHEEGDHYAERSAFVHGFASTLVYGSIRNRLSASTLLGQKQLVGQKAAVEYLSRMPPDARASYLTRYRGTQRYVGENMDKALGDMGYHI